MATVICSHCSRVISVDGAPPSQCPSCGKTLDNAVDSTHDHSPLPLSEMLETVTHVRSEDRKTIGRYILLRELGEGGFGTVFLARDPKLDIPVAIKIPRSDWWKKPDHLERFGREARNAAQLRHPGIVAVYNVGEERDVVYIVTEYVDGQPLHKRLRQGPIPFRESASIVAAVSSAVEYAHSKRIIHRDIKPSNIMLDTAGNPRLLDFGLAKREEVDPTITVENHALGTPAYMSPEQAWGRSDEIDRRSDVYSLGATLYHLLTGELPFRGDAHTVREKVRTEEPKAPRSINAEIPRDLETICQTAMQKDKTKRYQTAGELAADLERWLRGEPILARHIGRAERTWRWCKRNPVTAGLLTCVALLLIGFAISSSVAAALAESGRKQAVAIQVAETKARETAEAGQKKEAAARALEAELRKKAEDALREKQNLLARAYVERGARYLRSGHSSDEYNPILALPWFYGALEVGGPQNREAGLIRLQTQLDFAPRVERMWFRKWPIVAAGISPKRDIFFVAGGEGTVELWRTNNSDTPAFTLRHPKPFECGAFSPDGALFATACADGIRVWSVATGELKQGPFRRTVAARKFQSVSYFHLIRFSRTGRYLVTAEVDGGSHICQVWDVSTGAPVNAPVVRSQVLAFADFADSDQLLVIAQNGGLTRVFEIKTGEEKKGLDAPNRATLMACVSADGTTVAGSPGDGQVILWNCRSGERVGKPLAHEGATIGDLKFSPDGHLLTTAAEDGWIRMWQVKEGRLLWKAHVFPDLQRNFVRLEFSKLGATLAVTHEHEGVVALDSLSGQLVAQPIASSVPLAFAGWANEGLVLTVSRQGVVRLWSMESNEPAFALPHGKGIDRALVSDDRKCAVTIGDGICCILRSGKDHQFRADQVSSFRINSIEPVVAALSPDGSQVAIANAEGPASLSIFDTLSHRSLHGAIPCGEDVLAVQFTPDARRLVCLTYDRRLVVWDVSTATQVSSAALPNQSRSYSFDVDGDGRQCAVTAGRQVLRFDLATGKSVGSALIHETVVTACRFAKGRPVLIAGCSDGRAYIWDLTANRLVASTRVQSKRISVVEPSPDGAVFLAGSSDGTSRLWSVTDAVPVSPVFQREIGIIDTEVKQGAVTPNARWVATVSGAFNPSEDNFIVHGWDAIAGDCVFVRSIRHLQSRFLMYDQGASKSHSKIALIFFGPEGRSFHIVGASGLFVTVKLDPERRAIADLQDDAAIRSGEVFDRSGDLRRVDPPELALIWKKHVPH